MSELKGKIDFTLFISVLMFLVVDVQIAQLTFR